jgi:hypothetical protein
VKHTAAVEMPALCTDRAMLPAILPCLARPRIREPDVEPGYVVGADARPAVRHQERQQKEANMSKHQNPSEGNGRKQDYDHDKTKPAEEAGGGRHDKDDKGEKDK